eukprot:5031782-Prymnesium_polylepis.2
MGWAQGLDACWQHFGRRTKLDESSAGMGDGTAHHRSSTLPCTGCTPRCLLWLCRHPMCTWAVTSAWSTSQPPSHHSVAHHSYRLSDCASGGAR